MLKPSRIVFFVLVAIAVGVAISRDRQAREPGQVAVPNAPARHVPQVPAAEPDANAAPRETAERPKPGSAAQTSPLNPGALLSAKADHRRSVEVDPQDHPSVSRERRPNPPTGKPDRLQVPNVVVRDLDGRVAYRGTVDLGPTLERIRRGERMRFHDDGITFENRERRLPAKGHGYYHEYVVPTQGLSGPGPQRIVTGADGEVYYTSDHYHSFIRIE
jgi:ribonuclease T1